MHPARATVLLACGVALAMADPSPALVGGVVHRVVAAGESLRTLGARFGVDPATLAFDNDIRPGATLLAGQVLRIDSRHIVPEGIDDGAILINVPQRMLFYRTEGRVIGFPVAVGSRGWPSPIRPFTIVAKEIDPTWDVPESIAAEARAKGRVLPSRVHPGPANPLGRHWLGLSVGSVGIHGTNAPASIYQAATHGCIRVHPDDVARVYDFVAVGTAGRFIYDPVLIADNGDDVFLEVHPDVYRRGQVSALEQAQRRAESAGVAHRIDWKLAAAVAASKHGVARVVTAR